MHCVRSFIILLFASRKPLWFRQINLYDWHVVHRQPFIFLKRLLTFCSQSANVHSVRYSSECLLLARAMSRYIRTVKSVSAHVLLYFISHIFAVLFVLSDYWSIISTRYHGDINRRSFSLVIIITFMKLLLFFFIETMLGLQGTMHIFDAQDRRLCWRSWRRLLVKWLGTGFHTALLLTVCALLL